MNDYIRPGTQFPKYFQFPEFLLRAPISQTAKLAYMVLYDRARLSMKNDWVADGKIYTVYPIADLAETLGKSAIGNRRKFTFCCGFEEPRLLW